MLHALEEDASRCCRRRFAKLLKKDALDATESWTCDTCGCEYRAQLTGPVRHWVYVVNVAVFRHG